MEAMLARLRSPYLAISAALLALVTSCAPAPAASNSPVAQSPARSASAAPSGSRPVESAPVSDRLVFTYYFYWYDAGTGQHMDQLNMHFPADQPPSWGNAAWHRGQLADMTAAGIDVALPVYWGFDRPQDQWSTKGLDVLGQAWRAMTQAGQTPPRIGMFLDTSIVGMRDLTSAAGKQWFYANFKDFFSRIPREAWALVDRRPVAFLFTSDFTAAVDQLSFDYVYDHFQTDYGVRPYIVREVSWDYPILRWENGERVRDRDHPIKTDDRYLWNAPVHGYNDCCGVAAVGPGYDERGIPGRAGTYIDRQNGQFYRRAFEAAIAAGKSLLAIETWNEFHEATGIAPSREYGRTYVDLTRELVAKFRARK